ncbi:MAG: hypothetical protein IEMM0008_1749 [bacterium]|nr:MAG: hypothetical protein IEMM0008_1749 [bacterium]
MANQEKKVSKVTLIFAGILLMVIGYFTTSWVVAKVDPSNTVSQVVEGDLNPVEDKSFDDPQALYKDQQENMAPYSTKTTWKPQQQAKPFGSYSSDIFPEIADKYKKYQRASFKLLAGYTYREGKKIPRRVKRLDKKKITLEGFMLPIDLDPEKNVVRAFFLLRDQQACCFGVAPKFNELVVVVMDIPCGYFPDVPIRVHGQFSVGEKKTNGMVESLYRMKAEIMVPPKGVKPL